MAAGRKAPAARGEMGAEAAAVRRAERGRTGVATTPVHFRGPIEGDGTLERDVVRARLGSVLGRYAWRIERVDVALSAKSPARGAPTQVITLEVSVAGRDPLVVAGSGRTTRLAFSAALRNAERSLRRWIERRRRTAARARPKR